MQDHEKTRSQFASEVVNFSSQYGSEGSTAYVARNLAGPRTLQGKYGDFTEAMVLRTYGPWWQRCPSAPSKLKKTASNFQSEDFIELKYKEPVIPTDIYIYETYHPGSVVRILACNANPSTTTNTPGQVEWVTLWSGEPQCSHISQEARTFSPPLKNISFPTSLIRLEFNSVECLYYTELDAVELKGKKPKSSQTFKDRALGFKTALTTRLLKQLSLTDRQTSIPDLDDEDFEKWGYFAFLPDEVIQLILSFLDVVSLCSIAQTCSLLLKNVYDPLLFTDLDLQSRWNTVDDVALSSLSSRCSSLQRLNLSWTGGGGQITEQAVCKFLEDCGSELKTLRLACCQYITERTIKTIASVCKDLEELDLQSCRQLNTTDFVHIEKLNKLKRLNLYSMHVDSQLFDTIGKCDKLEHLNLGASIMRVTPFSTPNGNTASLSLSRCLAKLRNLVSLDLWRCKYAERDAIEAIAKNCPNLQELDIGWCSSLFPRSRNFDTELLCSKCSKIKKLYLTSGRNIGNDDLQAIAKHCRDLEQLDILGTNLVSFKTIEAVCKACPKLFFFDLSFCSGVDNSSVAYLREHFPHINFKKSFQD